MLRSPCGVIQILQEIQQRGTSAGQSLVLNLLFPLNDKFCQHSSSSRIPVSLCFLKDSFQTCTRHSHPDTAEVKQVDSLVWESKVRVQKCQFSLDYGKLEAGILLVSRRRLQ